MIAGFLDDFRANPVAVNSSRDIFAQVRAKNARLHVCLRLPRVEWPHESSNSYPLEVELHSRTGVDVSRAAAGRARG